MISCGRKQKDIFYFPESKPVVKVNKLSLPYVKHVNVEKNKDGNKISWQPVLSEKKEEQLLGYNVYRLVRASIVPKKPLNKIVTTDNVFLDKSIFQKDYEEQKYCNCYMVTAVFDVHDKVLEGPSSQIVCEK